MRWEPTQYLKYSSERLRLLPAARDGEHPVVGWTKGTALTPFLAALDVHAQHACVVDYTARIDVAYPRFRTAACSFRFAASLLLRCTRCGKATWPMFRKAPRILIR